MVYSYLDILLLIRLQYCLQFIPDELTHQKIIVRGVDSLGEKGHVPVMNSRFLLKGGG